MINVAGNIGRLGLVFAWFFLLGFLNDITIMCTWQSGSDCIRGYTDSNQKYFSVQLAQKVSNGHQQMCDSKESVKIWLA